ncbi:hypothetical protein [Deinococcus alpinitundrae]|uniref:hypothetical protein n=1 Tax=Deinococcus alpinitundrae TaxID=468913 RepID=UPI00137B3157|nr:hypothetical protein [Deinococcus alpinitundrae]
MCSDLTPYLGQMVRVVVDRPLGSVHPRWPGLISPVSDGELPGTLGGESKDKLIVVRPGTVWTEAQLWSAVQFQERFSASRLVTLPP